MGVLSDGPVRSFARGGRGEKFVRIFRQMDAADRELIRTWVEDQHGLLVHGGIQHVHTKVSEHFDVGYTCVEHGIHRLREAQWEC